MEKRAVIALGGNALGNTPSEQRDKIKQAAPHIIDLIEDGYEIVVTHGNGPQVGMINLAFDEASQDNSKVCRMEFPECAAMSQGYIGYHLQSGLQAEIQKRKMPWKTVTVITRVEVDGKDSAFAKPEKPIGGYYTKEQVERLAEIDSSFTYTEDAGRGYRRTIASPAPINIIEKDSVLSLLENEFVVITTGGGGIPVVKSEGGDYRGVDAVIDKDLAAAKLAELIDASYLLILTAVDSVYLNWGEPDQKRLDKMNILEAKKYCDEGQFAPGSMLPKIKAAMDFVSSGTLRKAVICSIENAAQALDGDAGTTIF